MSDFRKGDRARVKEGVIHAILRAGDAVVVDEDCSYFPWVLMSDGRRVPCHQKFLVRAEGTLDGLDGLVRKANEGLQAMEDLRAYPGWVEVTGANGPDDERWVGLSPGHTISNWRRLRVRKEPPKRPSFEESSLEGMAGGMYRSCYDAGLVRVGCKLFNPADLRDRLNQLLGGARSASAIQESAGLMLYAYRDGVGISSEEGISWEAVRSLVARLNRLVGDPK